MSDPWEQFRADCNLDYFYREPTFDDSNPDYDTEEKAEERRLLEGKYGVRRDFTYEPDPLVDHVPDGGE